MFDSAFQSCPPSLFCNVALADLKTVLSLYTLSQTFYASGPLQGHPENYSKATYWQEFYLNMWRRHYGEVLFGNIVNHIAKLQGHPTTIFGKYLFGRRFEIYTFRNICCKISCLPASPRIFENLKNVIIAYC